MPITHNATDIESPFILFGIPHGSTLQQHQSESSTGKRFSFFRIIISKAAGRSDRVGSYLIDSTVVTTRKPIFRPEFFK
jgi:hypothetical protein